MKYKVLIVDKCQMNQLGMKQRLTQIECGVVPVETIDEMNAHLNKERYDLVISNLQFHNSDDSISLPAPNKYTPVIIQFTSSHHCNPHAFHKFNVHLIQIPFKEEDCAYILKIIKSHQEFLRVLDKVHDSKLSIRNNEQRISTISMAIIELSDLFEKMRSAHHANNWSLMKRIVYEIVNFSAFSFERISKSASLLQELIPHYETEKENIDCRYKELCKEIENMVQSVMEKKHGHKEKISRELHMVSH